MWLKNLILKVAGKKAAKALDLQEGPMDSKKWHQSKTIWSDVLTIVTGVYAIVAPVLAAHGHNLPPIPGWILTVLGGMGIVGRATATTTIG